MNETHETTSDEAVNAPAEEHTPIYDTPANSEGSLLEEDAAKGRSLLFIWNDILSNVEEVMSAPLPIGIAGRIVRQWPHLAFQDLPRYHAFYHEVLLDIREALHAVIEKSPQSLDVTEDDDMDENGKLYEDLVLRWNIIFDKLELKWRTDDANAHIDFAALVDARAFIFSSTGLAGHLEARGFTMDTDVLADAILAARGEYE